jgi:hypothetical protein
MPFWALREAFSIDSAALLRKTRANRAVTTLFGVLRPMAVQARAVYGWKRLFLTGLDPKLPVSIASGFDLSQFLI